MSDEITYSLLNFYGTTFGDEWIFHSELDWVYDFLPILGFNLIHVSKGIQEDHRSTANFSPSNIQL